MNITINLEDHDFQPLSGAADTLRAIADVIDPQAATLPVPELTEEQRQVLLKHAQRPSPVTQQLSEAGEALYAAMAVGEVSLPADLTLTDGSVSIHTVGYAPPPPEPAPNNAGVDANGRPWDERIHASSRATVADGTWRMKRGVSDELVAQVRAEWDAKMAAPTEAERLQADHDDTMPPDPATVGFGAPAVPPPPPAPAATEWPTAELGARDPSKTEFQQFVGWAMAQMSAGKFTNERLLAALQANDVPILPALAQPEQSAKIGAIVAQLTGA